MTLSNCFSAESGQCPKIFLVCGYLCLRGLSCVVERDWSRLRIGPRGNPDELMFGDIAGYLGENHTDFQVEDESRLWREGFLA